MRRLVLLLIVLGGVSNHLFSQAETPFANAQDWKVVTSENFDVYFFGNNEAAAVRTAKFAEIARYEIGVLFDFKPTERYTLVYASDPMELMSSNVRLGKRNLSPGVFNLPEKFATVVHPLSGNDWFAETKKAVALLILDEFTYGHRLGQTLQSELLFYSAPWYREGLAEYVAYGWTYEDEMWMSSIVNSQEDLLDLVMEGSGNMNRVARKSIWHFITHEYGEQKISEILYLINISHSIESGIIAVLGLTLNTLTERWREYIVARFDAQIKNRQEISKISNNGFVPVKEGYELIGFAYNSNKNTTAVWLNKNGSQSLQIYDSESGQFTETGIKTGFSTNESHFYRFAPPLAWNFAGTELATTVFREGKYQMAIYDSENNRTNYSNIPGDIHKIMQLAWSHEGSSLVISAFHNGQTDLFTTRTGSGQFQQITDDIYDDLDPSWSFDDEAVFFSSNRESGVEDFQEEYFRRNFDLYKYTRTEGQVVMEALTSTPEISERQPYPTSSFELVYVNDENGIYNLGQVNIFQKFTTPFSNLSYGILRMQTTERMIAVSSPEAGKLRLYLIPSGVFKAMRIPEPTLLKLEYAAVYQEMADNARQLKAKETQDTAKTQIANTDIPVNKEEEKKVEEEKEDEVPAVKYYIFDEDNEPYEARKPERSLFDQLEDPLAYNTNTIFGDLKKPLLSEVQTDRGKAAKSPWMASYFGMNLNYDPLAKMGMEFRLGFTDLFKNHRLDVHLQPFFNLKNSISDVRYSYLKHKLDFFGELGYTNRMFREPSAFQSDSMIFRYDHIRLNAGAKYPLSSFAAVEASVGYHSLNRNDLQLLHASLLNKNDHVFRAGLQFTFDNTLEKEGFQYKGMRISAGFESYFSATQGAFAFHRANLQITHYKEVYNKMVLASRFITSFNFPKSLPQYYMGGVEDQIHPPIVFPRESSTAVRNNSIDTSLYSFHYLGFVQNMRGFRPNTRDGSRYLLANFELRIPISRLTKHTLTTNSLYKLEVIPFIDAGTVWVEGNPFSKKEPTDTQIISTGVITVKLQTLKSPFLIGFGSGVRAKVLTWSLRMDLAWGIDDYTLRKPMLNTTVAKNF
ncbi:MAG: hypothetical protein SF052_01995 [Bacteroidia bacterium]|nr:hypothetical protein [Bacteroidia bacterium]